MGGSSSSGSNWVVDPDKTANKIRQNENNSLDNSFNTEINSLINNLLTDINNRDVELIRQHLQTVIDALETDIEGSLDIRYGGSVSKHTYVDGLSDIDTLALIDKSELKDKTPHEVKEYFRERIQQRLPNTKVTKGNLAITIKYSDGTLIQVLPALKSGSGYKIAADDNNWAHTDPKRFVYALRSVNIENQGKLVPMIKIAKSIISNFPDKRKVSGYHTEALAVEIFSNYDGKKVTKEMIKHFFKEASNRVLNPIKDKSGQSTHVDEYLGKSNSIERKMVSDSFAQVSRKMNNADGGKIIELWKEILNL